QFGGGLRGRHAAQVRQAAGRQRLNEPRGGGAGAQADDHPGLDAFRRRLAGAALLIVGAHHEFPFWAAFLARMISMNRAAQPALAVCWPRARARSPGATSRVTTEPEPTMAPAPMLIGATSELFEPTKAPSPTVVRYLKKPS